MDMPDFYYIAQNFAKAFFDEKEAREGAEKQKKKEDAGNKLICNIIKGTVYAAAGLYILKYLLNFITKF